MRHFFEALHVFGTVRAVAVVAIYDVGPVRVATLDAGWSVMAVATEDGGNVRAGWRVEGLDGGNVTVVAIEVVRPVITVAIDAGGSVMAVAVEAVAVEAVGSVGAIAVVAI